MVGVPSVEGPEDWMVGIAELKPTEDTEEWKVTKAHPSVRERM